MKNDRLAWPILLLLLTVLVPSLGVVWMMREAVNNERLATGQRLREAYQVQLQSASQIVQERWSSELEQLARKIDLKEPAHSFADIISQQFVDSVLICDQQNRIVYPDQPMVPEPALADPLPEWETAESLEFAQQQFAAAAEAYAQIVRDQPDAKVRARARQAQVRCLLRIGEQETAILVLEEQSQQNGLHDEYGRSFAAAAELRLLELLDRKIEAHTIKWNRIAEQLAVRLGNYQDSTLPSTQRRFLMMELQRLSPQPIEWATQAAEVLSAEAVAVYDPSFLASQLQPTSMPELWSYASRNGHMVGLVRTLTIRKQLLKLTDGLQLPSGVAFAICLPEETSQNLMDTPLGANLGRWRLGLLATAGDPFNETSQQRQAVHVWIAILVVAVTCVLAWLLAGILRRRLRLAQLKNDLVATVSHELKTPLASIRLLVDTLLEADGKPANKNSPVQVREYLQLIAQENARLTRLIDNFLTFSRMERGMQSFDFQVIDLQEVNRQAAAVFREHWDDADSCLQVEEGQPAWVLGDLDTLVTAVGNLLENAWKYSDEQKQIVLSASSNGERTTIAVRDNGIGLPPRAASHVFDRFFQVDQRVARSQGGCGLGLSIVQAIIQAHGGEARVKSQLGVGSTFTLCMPKHSADNASDQSQVEQEANR